MIAFEPTDEQRLLQDSARAFAQAEIAPAARRIREGDPAASPWVEVKPVFAKGAELGLTRLLIPEAYGGLGGTCLDQVLVMEELGAADHGIAASYFNVTMAAAMIFVRGGTEDQRQRWLPRIASEPDFVLASASSEPNVAGADSFCPDPDPRIGLRSRADRRDDHYLLTGAKSGFSTNAGAAKGYFVMARTDLQRPARESTAMFFVPAETAGLTVGRRTDLIGWRTACQAEVLLEEVQVPARDRIGGDTGDAGAIFFQVLPFLAAGLAATYVGLARSALELALSYAEERRSWGQPIINHQAVALKLADMCVELEAARLMVWRLAAAADAGDPRATMVYAPAAKTTAVRTAIRNAERAVQILGSYGITREYGAGRLLEDAWIGESCDGTHDMLRLNIVHALRGPPATPGSQPAGMPPVH